MLNLLPNDYTAPDVLKEIEGVRFDRRRQVWTLPASLRCLRKLEALGFQSHPTFKQGTDAYIATLQRPVPEVAELPVYGERTLLPHQASGVEWLRTRKRALLADEQGTGKTIHAIAWAYNDPLVIIVASLVLLPQWAAEMKRMGVRWEPHYFNPIVGAKCPNEGWVLVNPEKLHRLGLPDRKFTLICDESSMFKNTKTRRTKAAMTLAARAEKVLFLDGNAMPNRPIELWTTYLMLEQRERPEFWKWAERYTGSFRTPYGWDFSGATFIDELAEDMTAFSLRREANILKLPEMFEQTIVVPRNEAVYAELSARAQVLKQDIERGESLRSGDGFMHLQNLRVEAALAKVPYASDWLMERTQRSKVVCFSEFKEPLRILQADFNEANTEGQYLVKITGDESPAVRAENIARFNEDEKCVGLLATYAVGERGLNLQVADSMLLIDLPWTPSALAQAKARIHRLGQSRPTEVITLMSGHPVEDLMLNALMHKQDILDGLYNLAPRKEFAL